MPINPGNVDNDEYFPQPLATGQALISDVAPDLKRPRPVKPRIPFGFVAPAYHETYYTPARNRHRGTVRSSR